MKLPYIYNLVMSAPKRDRVKVSTVMSYFRRTFKRYPWIRFVHKKSNYTKDIIITGSFEPERGKYGECVVVVYDSTDGPIPFRLKEREKFLFEVFNTIAHERVHLLQSLRMEVCPAFGEKISGKYAKWTYYGSPLEIQAFALNSALECKLNQDNRTLRLYRSLFPPFADQYKRFQRKRCKFLLTLPDFVDINR